MPGCSRNKVQRDQTSRLRSTFGCDRLVIRAGERFIRDRIGIVTGIAEDRSRLDRQVLVYLEFHALSSAGRSMEPSRANSAAYATAASMSSGFREG